MLPLKMQSRSKRQPESPWTSEPALFVGRKARQPSGSVNLAKNQSREPRQFRRLDPTLQMPQSFAPPERTRSIRAAIVEKLAWHGAPLDSAAKGRLRGGRSDPSSVFMCLSVGMPGIQVSRV